MNPTNPPGSLSSFTESPIAPAVQAVLELFATDLGELRFPDVDQQVLAHASAAVLSRAEEVAAAEAMLLAAKEALLDASEALLGKCQRALAYARIYAEDDRELQQKLEVISLPRSRRAAALPLGSEGSEARVNRRGRRAAASSGPLFLDSTAAPAPTGTAGPESDSIAA
jgi:hypothetical protein